MRYCTVKTKRNKCPWAHYPIGHKWYWVNDINQAYRDVERENKYQQGCDGCDCYCEVFCEE